MDFNHQAAKDSFLRSDSPGSSIRCWTGNEIREAGASSRHILSNRLISNEITALYGEPKAGKTFVAIACAVACSIGSDFWGQKFSEGGAVIYVAAERLEQAAERICAQFQHQGFESVPQDFVLVGGVPQIRLSDMQLLSELKELVSRIGPSLIVFDTYVRITDNDEDKARDADNNIVLLTEIVRSSSRDCAGLLVHHAGKDQSRGMRGSSALLAAVTTVWKVSRKSKARRIQLSMEDANAMEVAEPCHFEIVTESIPSEKESGRINVGVAVSAEETQGGASRPDAILEIIRRCGTSGITIDDLLPRVLENLGEGSESTLRRVLTALVADERLVESRRGKKIAYACP